MKLQDVLVCLRLALENLLLFTKWLETVLLLPAYLGVLCPDPSVSLFCPPSLDERLEEYNGRWHGTAALDLNECIEPCRTDYCHAVNGSLQVGNGEGALLGRRLCDSGRQTKCLMASQGG